MEINNVDNSIYISKGTQLNGERRNNEKTGKE